MISRRGGLSARLAAILAAAALSAAPLRAQGPDPAGRWEGAIELPGQKLEVRVDLAAELIQPDGIYSAKKKA